VLWNLCLNAAQALSQGGHITLRARALVHGARDGVCIEVLDDGPGIPSRLREGAFRPFETTRVGGTGLGLALARHSIALHDGWIEIDDAPGGGACVRFWLPADGPAAVGSHTDEEWD
jgi:signal transduction histidine kinase